MSALGTPLPKQLHTPQPSSAILTHPRGVAGSDKGEERGANATPTALSVARPQPPAKQVCDIMPLVPLQGPGEQFGGLEQKKGGAGGNKGKLGLYLTSSLITFGTRAPKSMANCL